MAGSSRVAMMTAEAGERSKGGLGWMEWMRGWMAVIGEMLIHRITASHLQNPLTLPPVNDLTFAVTGSTSGIGLQIARQLPEAGAHVIMAVRNPKAAHELIEKWQNEWSSMGLLLNAEGHEGGYGGDNEMQVSSGGHWLPVPEAVEGLQCELPFEFQILAITLEVVCTYLDSSVADLEMDAYPVLDELARSVSTKNLEHVRSLKIHLTRLLARV